MNYMILTQKNQLKTSDKQLEIVKQLSYYSARLYNVGLYSVRQYYFLNSKYLNYAKNYHECKTNENYKLLLTDTSQQILRLVDRNFKSFFALLRLKSQGKYSEKIGVPKYKKKDELGIISIQGRSCRIKNGKVLVGLSKAFRQKHIPGFKNLIFDLPKNIKAKKLQEIRIIPIFGGKTFDIEFIYKKEINPQNLDKNNYLSIDMGLNNFATCYNSIDGSSFIIDGRYLKSINHQYNKEKAKLQSLYDSQGVSNNTNKMLSLSRKRGFRINDYFNRSVKQISDYCISKNIGTVVIGNFAGCKDEINLRKVNNQNFVMIPHGKFKQKLESKCQQLDIKYVLQEESYTSKCSFLDSESVEKHKKYLGKRTKRGLFITAKGLRICADINGAANILVKYLESNGQFANRYGCVNHPTRLKLVNNKFTSKIILN